MQHFDEQTGEATFHLMLNGKEIAHWTAAHKLPGYRTDGDTSIRKLVRDVKLKPGDRLELIGHPQGREPAPFDYVVAYPAKDQSGAHD